MSPIGRIFVVINLVLAALFLGWAASHLSTAQKYRAESESNASLLAAATTDWESKEADFTSRVGEAERLRQDAFTQRDTLKSKADSFEQDLAAANDELAQFRAEMGNVDTKIGDLSTALDGLRSQLETASNERVAAVESQHEAEQAMQQAVAARQTAEDEVNRLKADVSDLRKQLKTAREDLQDAETTIAAAVESGFNPGDTLAAPRIDGAILDVSNAVGKGLVHINRGSNDNVKQGYTFNIFSGQTFKGIARVDIVNGSTCTARIIQVAPGTTIQQGDRASTQI